MLFVFCNYNKKKGQSDPSGSEAAKVQVKKQ